MKDKNLELVNKIIHTLKSRGFKITAPRFFIIKYLVQHRVHPSPEQIYNAVKNDFPTLSLPSVYNTLDLLLNLGFIRKLKIHDDFLNYDIDTSLHHHLFCEKCGKIYDLPANYIDISLNFAHSKNIKINHYSLVFYGICEKCLAAEKNEEKN